MKYGNYQWNIDLTSMDREELQALNDCVQICLEDACLDEAYDAMHKAFKAVHDDGYKVFIDEKEISFDDIYIATIAP